MWQARDEHRWVLYLACRAHGEQRARCVRVCLEIDFSRVSEAPAIHLPSRRVLRYLATRAAEFQTQRDTTVQICKSPNNPLASFYWRSRLELRDSWRESHNHRARIRISQFAQTQDERVAQRVMTHDLIFDNKFAIRIYSPRDIFSTIIRPLL